MGCLLFEFSNIVFHLAGVNLRPSKVRPPAGAVAAAVADLPGRQ